MAASCSPRDAVDGDSRPSTAASTAAAGERDTQSMRLSVLFNASINPPRASSSSSVVISATSRRITASAERARGSNPPCRSFAASVS